MNRILLVVSIILIYAGIGIGQNTWGLERCVDYALENNIQIKQSKLSETQASLSHNQSKRNQLPNLTGSTGFQLSWGRNIDPITNVFRSQTLGFNSHSISTGMMLYNGGNLKNTITRDNLSYQESQIRTRQLINDISLNVVTAYMNAVFEQERAVNAASQLEITRRQLDRVEKLITAGSLPESDRYDFQSQLARDQQLLIIAENNIVTTLLILKQLLQLPPEMEMLLERPDIEVPDVDPDVYTFDDVYGSALNTQPSIKADEISQQISELDITLARAQFYPTVTFGGSLSTTFATIAKQIDGFQTVLVPQQGVFINGEPATFEVQSEFPTGTSKIPYFNQLDQNLGLGFGIQLGVPIYNRGQTKTNVEFAKLNAENQRLMNTQNKETLKSNVLSAVTGAQAGKREYEAAEATKNALEIAFKNTERKFEVGAANTYELTEAKNRFDVSINDLLIAKYDYIFRLKVIDYYLGNPIKLN